MNKTVNINLAGVFFHIDEDAYLKLQGYLNAIKKSFANTDGHIEIIADIEARISELFNERIQSSRQVVGVKEVDEVIDIMGQPEDYLVDDEIFEDDAKQSNHTNGKEKSIKKLFRDTDNSYISGVSSGLAHYLGIDPIWIRLIWVLLVMMSFGTFVFIYILLWILIPSAKTTADKIMMTGEPVNIDNIERQIKDSFETVSGVAKNVSESVSNTAKKHSGTIKNTSKNFFDALADAIMFIVKVCSKFIGVVLILFAAFVLIALILGVVSVGVKNILNIPGVDYVNVVNAGGTPIWLSLILFFLTVGIPFFFLFYLGLKICIKNLKSIGNVAKYTLLGLWLFALLGTIIVVVREVSEHSFTEKITEKKTLNITSKDTLKIKMRNNDLYKSDYYRSSGFKLAKNLEGDKLLYSRDVELIVKPTSDSLMSIVIKKYADGIEYEKAIQRAEQIVYDYSFTNNHLILNSFLSTTLENKYSDQEVEVFVYLPLGTVVELDGNTYNYNSYSSLVSKKKYLNHRIQVLKEGMVCLDCKEDFKVEVKTPKVKIDKKGLEINGKDGSLKIDENGIEVHSKDVRMKIDDNGVNVETNNEVI